MVLATSLAAASVLADLRDSKLFHTDTAWDPNVSVPPLNGHATKVVDLVGLFGLGRRDRQWGFWHHIPHRWSGSTSRSLLPQP
ncbi:Hypothetical protein FKW44_009584 [Caligus rogercresseyi]|uniref:Uncharacterized protein n=1 Tax=Caligus rogercresseyi TaxID=217165 RepID=A0A7T8HGH6_CALRO|nr:Hypothetical protein FKW44_009584 [Caligus rogercresseyi]